MSIKLAVLFVMILVAFAFLGIRLFIINRDNGDKYKKRVLSQQAYDSVTIPAKRGDIVDRNNTKLAVSQKVYNVCIDPKTLNKDDGAYLESTITALYSSPIEFTYTKDELRSYILANPDSQYRVIAKKQGYETVSDIMNMVNNPSMYPDFKGVWLEDTYVRQYPYNSLACDVIGFVQGDNEGAYGLEEFYNSTLVGTNGREFGYLNDDENLERTLKPAQDGKTLVTSIDVNIQSIVEKNILAFNEEHRNEAREGAGSSNTGVIIMDPNNGEVLAMASYPTFNLNDPRNTDNLDVKVELDPEKFGLMNGILDGNTDISEMDDSEIAETVRKLAEESRGTEEASDTEDDSSDIEINVGNNEENADADPADPYAGLTYAEAYDKAYEEAKMEALNSLWKNFCINSGILKGDESYVCNGVTEVGGHEIHCSNRLGHGTLTFSGALEQSCNVAFMKIGTTIGKTIFMKYNQLFNFGLKTNIDLTGEALTNSLVFDINTMTPTDLAISSFGQGFNVTMIQMATGFCSLINGGYYYKPHIVTKVLDSAGTTVETVEPRVLKQTVSEETSEKIRELCVSVVDNGTGKSARPAGYRIGGKTGTAEKYPRGTENYVISFMSFAPAENPQIVCYVVIDEPNVGYQAQSKYAAVLCKDILTEVLPYMGIFQTEELTEKEAEELAQKQQEFSTGSSGTEAEEEVTGEIIVDAEGGNSNSETGSSNGAITFVDENGNELDEEDRTGGKVEIDPETGYAIDPTTGILLDPQTGEPIDPTVTDLQ